MAQLKLYVGNKNYSSWSLRPWLALKAAGVDFKDEVIPFDFPAGNPSIKAVSETGRVPLLAHDDFKVWESLAIIDYVADLFPENASGRRTYATALWRAPIVSKWRLASARCATPAR